MSGIYEHIGLHSTLLTAYEMTYYLKKSHLGVQSQTHRGRMLFNTDPLNSSIITKGSNALKIYKHIWVDTKNTTKPTDIFAELLTKGSHEVISVCLHGMN